MNAQVKFADLAELVVIKNDDALAVFSDKAKLDPILAKVRAHIDAFEGGDVATEEGREKIKKMAFAVTKSKTALEAVGDKIAKEIKELPKKIDAGRKHVKDTLDAWRDEVRKPLTDWETADNARIKLHTDELDALKLVAGQPPGSADELRALIAQVEAIADSAEVRQEFSDGFKIVKGGTLTALREKLAWREKYDAEQAELAALRAAAAAREAEEAERRRIAADAEAKAGAEKAAAEAAERAAALAVERERERAEQERMVAERRALAEREAGEKREADLKAAAEAAERRALEAEAKAKADLEAAAAAERAEQERREKDKAHRGNINRAAVAALVKAGIPDANAKTAITAIAKGEIPAVRITY